MAVVNEIIRVEENGALSFGNYELKEKTKVVDFEVEGRLYKAKTLTCTRPESHHVRGQPGSAV